MFQIGDRIAHPMHGAGVISGIESRKINGVERDYYLLNLPVGGMQVMIPVDSCEAIGVRDIVREAEADRIIGSISGIEIVETQNWNKRYRENMLKIKSGDLLDVCGVIKSLMLRDRERGLSTGERKMLNVAKQILISELALSKNMEWDAVNVIIEAAVFASTPEDCVVE
ncbi:MAG: CarD family transcriptional regulator [Oscillospiraceae bacterium]|nr:CarD family transcriptional regulator [Oscillospiraceae bacterium]MBR6562083.1 CarD family transcriptional regulator [Oscillospiraceae bacterium]